MAVLGSTDLGDGRFYLTVDHDPTSVATDARAGSIIHTTVDSEALYLKLDDGSSTSVQRFPTVFGTEYQSTVNETRTSTTGEDTVRISLTVPAFTGTYIIHWTATVDSDNKIAELSLYNSTDTVEVDFWKFKTADIDYRHVVAGFYLVTMTGTSKTFQLRWGNEPGKADTIYIDNARLVGWRVA